MLGLNSYVKYYGDKYYRGTITGETTDNKWLVTWETVLNKVIYTQKVPKSHTSLIEIFMCDEPVKNVNGRLILESEFSL
jgi:hypothetical protein